LMTDWTYDVLRSGMDMHLLHVHFLLALAPVPILVRGRRPRSSLYRLRVRP
jgi:hypothetical protein